MVRTDQPYDPKCGVQVYFNLHRRCWSIRQRGLVVGHAKTITLTNVSWRVNKAGRERVRREGRKNVHAYADGAVYPVFTLDGTEHRVRYNPYELETFVVGTKEVPLFTSVFAHFTTDETGRNPRVLTRGINL